MNTEKNVINLVVFHSEGRPHDKGKNLTSNREKILEQDKHFNNISIYTPRILRELGFGSYVKEYKNTGVVSKNPGMSSIGFCAWRPKILLLELEKMNYGDILIYRDMNIKKSPMLGNYDNIRNIALKVLDIVNFDFFVPRQNHRLKLKQHTKTNVLRELGEDHPFSYNFPVLFSGLLVVIRKSEVSIELLKEWEEACLNDEWINGEKYGKMSKDFKWSCPEQSLMCVIIANWIRKKKHNISKYYPFIGFRNRNISDMFFYNTIKNKKNKDYKYLEYIDDE